MANEFRIKKGLIVNETDLYVSGAKAGFGTITPSAPLEVYGSGSTVFTVNGASGQLFGVSDDLTDSLFSVNTIAGLPVIEAFADNTVNIGTYGSEELIVSSSQVYITSASLSGPTLFLDGNVGIGTTSPLGKLHIQNSSVRSSVNGGADNLIIEENGYSGITILSSNANAGQIHFGDQNAENVGKIQYFHSDNSMRFTTNGGGERMRIDSSGNVGIGTTNPSAKLHVSGTIADNRLFEVGDNYLVVTGSNGNIGIGTTSPESGMHILRDLNNSTALGELGTNGTDPEIKIENDNATAGSFSSLFLRSYTGDARIFASTTGVSNAVNFGIRLDNTADTSGITRFYIEGESGNVGIGTTSPTASLHVEGVGYFSGGSISFSDTVTDAGIVINENDYIYTRDGNNLRKLIGKSSTDVIIIGQAGTSLVDEIRLLPGSAGFTSFYDDSSESMRITGGNVGIGTTSPPKELTVEGEISSSGGIYSEGAVQADTFRGDQYPTNSFLKFDDDQTFAANMTTLGAIGAMNFIIDTNDNDSESFTWWHGNIDVDSATQLMDLDENGNLTVTGIITAQEFHTEFVSASIIYQSGSTKFGDTSDDVHEFSGSIRVSGSGDHYFSDGNVGIGTTSPSYNLDIHSGTGVDDRLGLRLKNNGTGDGDAIIYLDSSATGESDIDFMHDGSLNWRLRTGDASQATNTNFNISNASNAQIITLEQGGNVGIGTTNPSTKLEVNGGSKFNELVTVVGDIYPETNYVSNIGAINKKFLTLNVAELIVETLVASERRSTVGGRFNVGISTQLSQSLASGSTTIIVENNNLNNGDIIHLEGGVLPKVEFMEVTSTGSATSGDGYSYTVTRDLDGSGANDWDAGSGVFNTGQIGNGFIDQYAINSLTSGSGVNTAGPTIAFMERTGSLYPDIDIRAGVGNLKGWYGYTTESFGFAAGNYKAQNITVDPTNGLRIRDIDEIQLQAQAGSLTIGDSFLYNSDTGVLFVSGSNIDLVSPSFFLGNSSQFISGSGGNLQIESTNFTVATNGDVSLTGTITAEAGNIGGFAITSDAITGSGFYLSGSATGTDFFISSSNFNVKANGDVTGSSVLFDGGKISGSNVEIDVNTLNLNAGSGAIVIDSTNEIITVGNGAIRLDNSFGTEAAGLEAINSSVIRVSADGTGGGISNYMTMFHSDTTNWGMEVYGDGNTIFFAGEDAGTIKGILAGFDFYGDRIVDNATADTLVLRSNGDITGSQVLFTGGKISGSAIEFDVTNFVAKGDTVEISGSNFHLLNGNITASNVDLSGNITATTGNIGGFAITSDAITGSGFYLSGSATGNQFFISASNFNVKANGDLTASNAQITGDITATSGQIAGFTISGDTIVGSAYTIDASAAADGEYFISSSEVLIEGNGDARFGEYSFALVEDASGYNGLTRDSSLTDIRIIQGTDANGNGGLMGVGPSGDFYIAPISASILVGGGYDAFARELKYSIANDRWEFDTNVYADNDFEINQILKVNDYARIDALRVGTTNTDPGDGILYVENQISANDIRVRDDSGANTLMRQDFNVDGSKFFMAPVTASTATMFNKEFAYEFNYETWFVETPFTIGYTNGTNTSYTLDVNGTSNLSGNTTIAGDLVVTGNTTISGSVSGHPDITQGSNISVNGSNGTVIQDLTITLDENGHVTTSTAGTVNLDNRYLQLSGGTLTGNVSSNSQISSTKGTIGFANLANAGFLAGTTSNGIGIDSNEIRSKGTDLYIGTIDANKIDFGTGGVNGQVVIASGGNVGIGNDSPSAKLHISGSNDVLLVEGSGSTLFDIQGSQGQLFSVTDDLTGTLFSVNDISGIPILSVDSDDTVTMGTFGANTLVVTGSLVGIGTASPSANLDIVGGGGNTSPTLELNSSTSTTFNHAINAFNSNLTSGENQVIVVGREGSTKNSGYIGYKWSGAASNLNVLTFGHWGNDNLMNLTADGKLGIGTTSPSRPLTVEGSVSASGDVQIGSGTSANAYGRLQVNQSSNTDEEGIGILSSGAGRSMRIWVDETNSYVSSGDSGNGVLVLNEGTGNVGIGTTSPNASYKTHIEAGSGNNTGLLVTTTDNADVAQVILAHDEGLQGGLQLISDKTNGIAKIRVTNSSFHPLAFEVRGTDGTNERMRIDSSGNLLVGTTSTALFNGDNGEGFSYRAGNELTVARSGASPVTIVRQTNDGNIIAFKKDTSLVGSIGTIAGDLTIGDADVGIRFDTGTGLVPWNLSTNLATDNAIDIGASSARFKDLYLGGTGYIDGDLTVGGIVTAQEFHTEFVSASIIYQSGSTKFGDTSDDLHEFTGSINILTGTDDGVTIRSATRPSLFLNSTGGGTGNEWGIRANGENFEIVESEDSNRLAYRIVDGTSPLPTTIFQHEFYTDGSNVALYISGSGNVGIGTTSPGTTLDVKSSINGINTIIQNDTHNAVVQILASVNAKNSELWFGDAADGDVGKIDYDHADNSMAFITNTSERLRIDSNGDLLIGGTSKLTLYSSTFRTLSIQPPSGDNASILELAGNRNANPGNQNAMIQFFNKTGTATEVSRISSLQGSDVTSGSITFNTNDSGTFSEKVRIQSDGNVGIGTTSPTSKLEISTTDGTESLRINNSDFTLTDGELVGEILFTSNDTTLNADRKVVAGIKSFAAENFSGANANEASLQFFTANATDLRNSATPTPRMIIDEVGNVGIGTSNPTVPLQVEGTISGSGTLKVQGDTIIAKGDISSKQTYHDLYIGGTGLASTDSAIYIGNQGDGTGYGWEMYYSGSGSGNENKLVFISENLGSPNNVITMLQDGNVGIGTTSPSTTLDVNGTATVTALVETSTRELKKDITELEDQSSIVDSLQPVSYIWKESEEEDFGLIAEDVEEIAPHLVHRDQNGKPTGIKYSKLSVLLLDVVQRQSTLIEDLNKRITKLENERG